MAEAKFDGITSRALHHVETGARPEAAWLAALQEVYHADVLASQVKHSCPKWAFCILCHRGLVRGVDAGCCPAAEGSSSAAYALRALDRLVANPSLASDKRELKRLVFGRKGESGYRTPNDEVEVLLALWEADALVCSAEVA